MLSVHVVRDELSLRMKQGMKMVKPETTTLVTGVERANELFADGKYEIMLSLLTFSRPVLMSTVPLFFCWPTPLECPFVGHRATDFLKEK